MQVGTLAALEFLAFPVLGLVAGVWADRLRRRPLLIVCDVLRMLALGSIPAAWALGVLTMGQLYVVAALTGVGTVFFDVAYQSYLPALIEREDLVEGNSKLEVTRSIAAVVGPALAGGLIQVFRAALAIAADAVSFLVSALSLLWIRSREADPRPRGEGGGNFLRELWEGVGVVLGNPLIRLIAGCTATSNLGSGLLSAVYLLFAYQRLRLSAGTVGLIYAIGSVGAVLGAMLSAPIARRLGIGPTLVVAITIGDAANFLVPLGQYGQGFLLLTVAIFLSSFGSPVYNVNQVSLRQAIVPLRLQGRLNATVRTVIWGTIPVGAALGGVLGAHIGLVPTLYLAAALSTAAVLWLLAGPVRLREIPVPAD